MPAPIPFSGLLPASYRGMSFHMIDSTSQAGRRWQSVAFPGADFTYEQDFGLLNGQIRIQGIVIGDDYILRGKGLSAAFQIAGPGVLIDPWLGPKLVVPIEPAEFNYRADKLRAVTFTATFVEWNGGPAAILSSLAGVLSSINGINVAALGLAVAGFSLDGAAGIFPAVTSALLGGLSLSPSWSLISMLPSFSSLVSNIASANSGPEAGSSFSGWCNGIVTAGKPLAKPAVGSGPVASLAQQALTPKQAFKLVITAAAALDQKTLGRNPQSLLTASARAYTLGAAAAVMVDIKYDSRDEAYLYRTAVSDAITSAASEAARLTVHSAKAASLLWTSYIELKRRLIEDIDERIGRLPSVQHIDLGDQATSAWLVAQSVAGDDPRNVLATYDDLVTRNHVKHPAVIGPGEVEVLPP